MLLSRELYWGVENMLVTNIPRIPGQPLLFLLEGKEGLERGCGLDRPLSGTRGTSGH